VREEAANFLLSAFSDFDDASQLLPIEKVGQSDDADSADYVLNF